MFTPPWRVGCLWPRGIEHTWVGYCNLHVGRLTHQNYRVNYCPNGRKVGISASRDAVYAVIVMLQNKLKSAL